MMALKASTAEYSVSEFGADHVSDIGTMGRLAFPNVGRFQIQTVNFSRKMSLKALNNASNF